MEKLNPEGYKETPSILADQKLPRIWAQMRGEGGGCVGLSQWVHSCGAHEAQINFGDLTSYLTYTVKKLQSLNLLFSCVFRIGRKFVHVGAEKIITLY